jgi:hypothetical protein
MQYTHVCESISCPLAALAGQRCGGDPHACNLMLKILYHPGHEGRHVGRQVETGVETRGQSKNLLLELRLEARHVRLKWQCELVKSKTRARLTRVRLIPRGSKPTMSNWPFTMVSNHFPARCTNEVPDPP